MAQQHIDTIWGSTGAVTEPTPTKQNLGWIAEIPPFQTQNWWQNRVDQHLEYLQQNGVEEWNSLVIYADQAIVRGADGILYQSQQAANLNHPVSDGDWWIPLIQPPRGYIQGLTMARAGGTTFNILGGSCTSRAVSGKRVGMNSEITFAKEIDVAWAEGNGAFGMLGVGVVLAAYTWYRVVAVAKPSGEMEFALDSVANADLSGAVAATTGAGYIYPRQIGWMMTNGLSEIRHFRQAPNRPEYIYWDSPNLIGTTGMDFDGGWPAGSGGVQLITALAPPHTEIDFGVQINWFTDTDPATFVDVWFKAVGDNGPTGGTMGNDEHRGAFHAGDRTENSNWEARHMIHVDANSQWEMILEWADFLGNPATFLPNVQVFPLGYLYNRDASEIL